MITNMLTRLVDVLIGPRCPLGCGARLRGWRTVASHCDREHADEDWTRGWL